MARYYYDRHEIITETVYEWHKYTVITKSEYSQGNSSCHDTCYSSITGYPSYTFNASTGMYSPYGAQKTVAVTKANAGTSLISISANGKQLTSYSIFMQADMPYVLQCTQGVKGPSTVYSRGAFMETVTGSYSYKTNNTRNSDGFWWVRGSEITIQKQGAYIDTITGEEDEFPVNGALGDLWYVRIKRAFPDFKIRQSGELRSVVDGWVRVDGQLKQIQQMWVRMNGQLKEV